MRRWLYPLCGALSLLVLFPQTAHAQTAWEDMPFERGGGFYLSLVKVAACWLLFLVWVSTADWINRDTYHRRIPYTRWTAASFFSFFGAFILLWMLPWFAVGFPLLVLAYAIPTFIYVHYRNARAPEHERVMTASHLRFVFAERLNAIGFNIATERKTADDLRPLELMAAGGATERDDRANLLTARQSPGFDPAVGLMSDALSHRARSMLLDFTQQSVAVRYEIDGVWQNGQSQEREVGDAVLGVYKTIAALNPAERRRRQQGEFKAKFGNVKYDCDLVSQGTKTGERAMLEFDDGSATFNRLDDLDMRDKLQEQVKELVDTKTGFLLFSAPPRQGLTATVNAALGSSDRFVRSWSAVEDVAHPERTVENIAVTTYDAAAGESPATVLPKLARMYPDAIVCRDLVDKESVELLCEQIEADRFVVASVKARDCIEALLRVLALRIDQQRFAEKVVGVMNQRLIRKLCETCKEAYAPTPAVLQQLRIPAGRVEAFYRPPQQPEKVCPDCDGIGYVGRVAVFELLVCNDEFRDTLASTVKRDDLRKAARKAGMRSLQEEGVLLVVKGVTSLPELMRVLKATK